MSSRVIVITGSTRGIGLELARACSARGDRVVIHGRERVAEVAASIDAIGIAADLASPDGPAALIAQALAACGRIDVLVNNAAISPSRAPFWETPIDETIAINLRAPQLCAQAVLAWSIPANHHVRIVNVSSGLATSPRAGSTVYASTKAGLEGFTRALALDVGDRATVIAVALGAHRTELSKGVLTDEEFRNAPEASAATRTLLHAITAPAEQLHGRVLATTAPALDVSQIDLLAHPIGPSPRARAALAEVALDRYPERDHVELRKVLAAQHGVPLDSIVLGGGITELLGRVLRAATRRGESAIAHAPSWPLLPHVLHDHGLRWKRVAYRVTEHVDHDLDAIEREIDRGVRAVYLTSPANPGGRALDTPPFERFLARVPSYVTVIVDEAYAEFATRDQALRAAKLTQWSDQLVVLRSFSKVHGLAGLRIGYAIAARGLARVLDQLAPAFPVVRGAAEAAFAAVVDHAHTRRVITEIIAARTRLEAALDARGIARLASDAPFVLADVPGEPRFFDRYVMLPAWTEISETTQIR